MRSMPYKIIRYHNYDTVQCKVDIVLLRSWQFMFLSLIECKLLVPTCIGMVNILKGSIINIIVHCKKKIEKGGLLSVI